ncbi:hypothetical protein P755_gp094 [Mycobacterium phage Quink]|uniref:hypothetical protein n=1 Tax=Mycobacterium phage Quink TaxID=1354514 RepID=UPI00021C4B06|nr:hypothetical protein P755_gp094 [Mycobacterium phage Quink]YP_009011852.1 hypothetical protein LILAC_93 [Mycobacterium phage Lilac]AEL21691.1 hypothetical protein LILAC_93 [Mycobacterium phage Lilac]AEL21833.1 hypothetical protein ELPH10_91 [Mycobacterium phage Elph10]AGU92505.1 hypothetical protein QUINK_94 [Mycobacterium phage Quink]
MKPYDPVITVCSRCLQASCWQGMFLCDFSYEANVVRRKVSTLIRSQGKYHEHPDYWNNDLAIGRERLLTVDDLKALGITDPNYLELVTPS